MRHDPPHPQVGPIVTFPAKRPLNGARDHARSSRRTQNDRRPHRRRRTRRMLRALDDRPVTASDRLTHQSPHQSPHQPAAGPPHASPSTPPRSPTAPAPTPASPSPSTARATPPPPDALLGEAERPAPASPCSPSAAGSTRTRALARRILDGGHELGNHTHAPPATSTRCPRPTGLRRDHRVRTAAAAASPAPSAPGSAPPGRPTPPRSWKPPGPHAPATRTSSRTTSTPSTSPRPARPPSPARSPAEIRNGSVVSLHFGYADTVAALPAAPRRTRPTRPARGDHHGVAELMADTPHVPRTAHGPPRPSPARPRCSPCACRAGSARPAAARAGGQRPRPRSQPAGPPSRRAREPAVNGPARDAARSSTRTDVYAADRPNKLSPVVKDFPSRVYVPNTESDTVTRHRPEDVQGHRDDPGRAGSRSTSCPSWDLKTLWVNNNRGHTLTPIDPTTGKAGKAVEVHDPYNLYFTPERQVRRRHGLPRPPTGLPRPAHHGDPARPFPVTCYGRQPRRLLARRPVLHRLLRVLRRTAQGRHREDEGRRAAEAPLRRGDAAGREDLAGRQELLHRRHDGRRHVGPGRRHVRPAEAPAHRQGRPRPLRQPRLPGDVRLQPRRGLHLRLRLHARTRSPRSGASRRRQPRHGRRLGRRQGPVAVRPLQLRGVRHRHPHRCPARPHPGRQGPHGLAVYPQPGRYSLGHTGIFR